MSTRQFMLGIFLAALLGGLIALGGYQLVKEDGPDQGPATLAEQQPVRLSNYFSDQPFTVPDGLNFVAAAEIATNSVVHIKSTYQGTGVASRSPFEDMFREFFGESPQDYQRGPARSFGSGVIISQDGYIATNNHVVQDAEEIEVTLNDNRRYKAKLIGSDPTTDLALVKIDQSELAYLEFGDSENLRVGEWVLAVGNPFDLYSTVTAGIVSAKGRGNLNILRDRNGLGIESFIQTDAAVNPGNSGGALVDLSGRLVGINTAIATPTGSYAGYSFAVPVSLVKKVMHDLSEFGVVQRALLGISILNVDAQLAEDRDLDVVNGVYVNGVNSSSAAAEAGIEEGDVIVAIDGTEVNNVAELQEQVALNRPGDQIGVTYIRDGRKREVRATLQNVMGDTEMIAKTASFSIEGATFETATRQDMDRLRIDGGAKIMDLKPGKWRDAGIGEGFIVTSIDKNDINDVNDLRRSLTDKKGGILIEGIYEDGTKAFFGLGW